jgi:aspartyl-tRNA(Asn)/glutamyl-tRNA(Gln) amidotransferase subunit A
MAAGAIGTDTGGSVRIPAALCGLAGFKPTARRVPRQGALPLSTQLDSVGPLAPTVRCCAVLDAILAGEDATQAEAMAPAMLRGLRLAVPQTLVLDGLDTQVAAAFAAALKRLGAAGVLIAQLASINTKGGLAGAEAWAWHRAHVERDSARYDPRVLSRILRGRDMSAADLLDLMAARSAWIATVERRVIGYDALLLPTVPIVAPKIAALVAADDAYYATNALMLRNPSIINFLDGCALSIPCHEREAAPVGLMVAGAGGSDARILAIGLAIEELLAANQGVRS